MQVIDKQGQVVIATELELFLDGIIDVLDILIVLGRRKYVLFELDVIREQVPDVVFLNDLEKFLSSQPVLQKVLRLAWLPINYTIRRRSQFKGRKDLVADPADG